MSEHRYSIAEIDRMRAALRAIVNNEWPGRNWGQAERDEAEDRLRTYMLNGTTPDELEAHALAVGQDFVARWNAKNPDRPVVVPIPK